MNYPLVILNKDHLMEQKNQPASFVAQINVNLAQKLRLHLQEHHYELTQPPYTIFQAKSKGVCCTLYESGKLVIQGKDKQELIEFYVEPEILGSYTYSHQEHYLNKTTRIGGDEAGKGDFYGPLCVSAVWADEGVISRLHQLGVADSKTLQDSKILKIAEKIKEVAPYEVLVLFPKTYNQLYEKIGNLNKLLAWAHATVLEKLTQRHHCDYALVDQFAFPCVLESAVKRKNINVEVRQETKAERDIVVAAASILARYEFVTGIEKLEKHYECVLPKGGGKQTLEAGKSILKQRGQAIFIDIAKVHFKNYREICGDQGGNCENKF